MNKIFINDKTLYLLLEKEVQKENNSLYISFKTNKEFKKTIQQFEKDLTLNQLSVVFSSEVQKKEALTSLYQPIEAAGGIVKNRHGNILFIFRNGKWDLPKGKIETGENEQEAALREVEEECGISNLTIEGKHTTTYHTYPLKGETILKYSHWYKMTYSGKSLELLPQEEEGITDARWMDETEIKKAMKNTFASIGEVMKLYYGN